MRGGIWSGFGCASSGSLAAFAGVHKSGLPSSSPKSLYSVGIMACLGEREYEPGSCVFLPPDSVLVSYCHAEDVVLYRHTLFFLDLLAHCEKAIRSKPSKNG